MSTRATSRWNRGEDPRLGKVSSALAAVAARGNSAAKADRDRAMALVDEAVGLEPADDYSPAQTRMFRDQQRKLIQSAAQFQRDADEFSGKPVGNYDTTEPWVAREESRAKAEAEKAVQRRGLSAEDYWERNPESKRTAVVKDWSGNPEVAKAVATGDSSKIKAAIEQAKKQGAQPTASIGADGIAASRSGGPTVRVVNVEDLAAGMEDDRVAQKAKKDQQQQKLNAYKAQVADTRKKNEQASRDRFDDFIIAQDERKRDAAKAEAYLKNFNRQARAMRRAATGNSYAGEAGAERFWELNADLQATAQNLRRMSREERLKWADSQVKAEEKARAAQVDTASRPSAITQEQLAEFFNLPMTLTDFVNTFFGGNRR